MKFSVHALFLFGIIFSRCTQPTSVNNDTSFSIGQQLSELTNKTLKESSGLAASINNRSMLWTHNDSGNHAEIYLIDKHLNIKLTVRLSGVENRDWEDIAVGPGPDSTKNYVYVGDIGDNDAVHPCKYIYRFPEPVLGTSGHISVSDIDKIVFKLEDGPKDTESLFIDTRSENLYVISKREEPVWLYELKASDIKSDTVTAIKKLALPFTKIVSADFLPATGDIVIKSYEHVYFWKNENDEDVTSLLKKTPTEIPYEKEPQGEAIAWATDGSGFYTLSEKKKKKPSYLYFYPRELN
jgi:hypothetical protein